MTAQLPLSHKIVTFGDLKTLASAGPLHITAVVPLPKPEELEVRLKNTIRSIQTELAKGGLNNASSEKLIAPIQDLAITGEAAGIWAHTLIVLRSPHLFRYYLLHRPFPELLTVEQRFQIRPLLATLTREQCFHVLCLSRHHVRLLHCTHHRAEEVPIHGIVPQNMDIWLHNRIPDHVLDNRATAGPSAGTMKGVVFGTSTDRDRDKEYLAHFFKEIDKGVTALLHEDTGPLILAGVEYELAVYRRVNTYSRLLQKAVEGSPDGLTGKTLHERAMDVVMQTFSEPLQKALSGLQKHWDTARVLTDAARIIKAAWNARISDLFISENAEQRGVWNEATQEIETGNGGEDLLNAAALQTVRDGGRAFVLNRADISSSADVVAVLRF